MPKKIILFGLGAISETHVVALESLSGTEIVAGVDIDKSKSLTFQGAILPVFDSSRTFGAASSPLDMRPA